jgi:hypothetical protein
MWAQGQKSMPTCPIFPWSRFDIRVSVRTVSREMNNTPTTSSVTLRLFSLLALGAALLTTSCVAESEEVDDATSQSESALTWNPKRHMTGKLGLPSRFVVGLGNDVTAAEGWDANRAHAFELGTKLDLHYLYLSGLDWPTWNADGGYVTKHALAAKARGVIPMFTLYQAAAWGENNIGAFNDWNFMNRYWAGVRTMYRRLGELGSPSVVHLEPDLWGYFQKANESPSGVRVRVGSMVPECAGLPEDVSGFGKCLVKLGRQLAPKAVIGLHASSFGAFTNGVSDPKRIASYLNKVGSTEADYLALETLDRDAGCFEMATDPNCKRSGKYYWADADFRTHLVWAKALANGTGKALLWWQMPLGVPAGSPGWSGHYRDNRVQWLFSHTQEFVDAGGVGAVFGTGAPNQTTAKSDGGQFKSKVTGYYSAPRWF